MTERDYSDMSLAGSWTSATGAILRGSTRAKGPHCDAVVLWALYGRAHKDLVESEAGKTYADEDEVRFTENRDKWLRDTVFSSSVLEMSMHPSYQRIIGMGEKALPFIFRDMQSTDNHWFWALTAITGHDPVAPADRGNITAMRQAWLVYAQQLSQTDSPDL